MAESNHNTMFIGTGEGFGGFGMVNGNGIFKEKDINEYVANLWLSGQNWSDSSVGSARGT